METLPAVPALVSSSSPEEDAPQKSSRRRLSRHRRRFTAAISMIEVMFSLAIFLMIVVVFGATFPTAIHAGSQAAAYNQAALIAQHKVDQLRQAGYGQIGTLASLQALGIVDPSTPTPYVNPNADGSWNFTYIDSLIDDPIKLTKGYYPGDLTHKGGSGTIKVTQALTAQGANAPTLAQAFLVTVTVSWKDGGLRPGTYTTHTIIAAP